MKLSNYERETVVTFNEAETTAAVYTHNPPLIRKLKRLAEARPEECSIANVTHDSLAYDFNVPKSWVKITPPKRMQLTPEQRQELSERMQKRHLQAKF